MKLKDNKYFSSIIIILILLFLIFYALSLKQDLIIAAGSSDNLNYWDLILYLLSDSYLFIYFILPLWLFIVVQHIKEFHYYAFIIRQKTYTRWILALIEICDIISGYFC